MGVFAYKGRNGRGELVEGTLEGDDSGAVADRLMKDGITPTDIRPSRALSGSTTGGTVDKPDWFKRLFIEKPITPIRGAS